MILLTEELEVTLLTVELVKADIGLDGDAGAAVADVRVAAGDDSKTFPSRLPGEIENGV